MARKLIIDGSAVYELDEECMLKKRTDESLKNSGNQEEKEKNKEEK